jgi:hypothetical protein
MARLDSQGRLGPQVHKGRRAIKVTQVSLEPPALPVQPVQRVRLDSRAPQVHRDCEDRREYRGRKEFRARARRPRS